MGAQESEVGPTVVHGEGDQDMDEALYLLLDLRDEAEYDACHINTAMPYPHTMVSPPLRCATVPTDMEMVCVAAHALNQLLHS